MTKLTKLFAALAVSAVAANAATVLTSPGPGGGVGNYYGQTVQIDDTGFSLSGDSLQGTFNLDSVGFYSGGNISTVNGGTLYLTVFDSAGAGKTALGTSAALDISGVTSDNTLFTFDFTGVTGVDGLSDSTQYFFGFTSDAAGTTQQVVRTRGTNSPNDPLGTGRWITSTGGSEENIAYDGTMVVGLTAVPEPSSAALLGLGGLALILRRRK